jgi:hypothetical protein
MVQKIAECQLLELDEIVGQLRHPNILPRHRRKTGHRYSLMARTITLKPEALDAFVVLSESNTMNGWAAYNYDYSRYTGEGAHQFEKLAASHANGVQALGQERGLLVIDLHPAALSFTR